MELYNNDKSSEAAIKRLKDGNTYTKQFEKTSHTANSTLGKTLTQKWGIDFSKDLQNNNSKDNSKNKDNSKDIDLDL